MTDKQNTDLPINQNSHLESTSRRRFLQNAALGTATALLLPALTQNADAQDAPKSDRKSPYYPWRMGIQSYSLRHYNTDEMLAKTAALGLKYIEAFPNHFPITEDPAAIARYKEQLKAHSIIMPAYGVVDFSADEADARRKFAFAKAMGIETLTASPSPESFPVLDKLIPEYGVRVAIHNHGPGDRYANMQTIYDAIQGHNALIGLCDDTGHFLRSDESPVSAAGKFGPRLYAVHLKNVKNGSGKEKIFTEIGETGGLLDTVGLLRVMKQNHFKGLISLEYEEHEEDPIAYIQKCLEATRRSINTVNNVTIRPHNE